MARHIAFGVVAGVVLGLAGLDIVGRPVLFMALVVTICTAHALTSGEDA